MLNFHTCDPFIACDRYKQIAVRQLLSKNYVSTTRKYSGRMGYKPLSVLLCLVYKTVYSTAEKERKIVTVLDFTLAGLAAIAGGAVNALAGGGTLITFPMLTAIGIPAVAANVTNTVALCPGYLGASFAQLKDLKGQERVIWILIPISIMGGAGGGYLLLNTSEKLFSTLVPYLILFASGLLAAQDTVRDWVVKHTGNHMHEIMHIGWKALFVLPAAVYAGYFGAGAGVIILAVLGLIFDENMTRLNALKQTISFSSNTAAAIMFLFSDKVVWSVVLVMAVGAMLGGSLGGRLAGKIKPAVLRRVVVSIGFLVGLVYLAKQFSS
jgi:uncharacterized membrane protein YfcA